jgi:hypothetical protein
MATPRPAASGRWPEASGAVMKAKLNRVSMEPCVRQRLRQHQLFGRDVVVPLRRGHGDAALEVAVDAPAGEDVDLDGLPNQIGVRKNTGAKLRRRFLRDHVGHRPQVDVVFDPEAFHVIGEGLRDDRQVAEGRHARHLGRIAVARGVEALGLQRDREGDEGLAEGAEPVRQDRDQQEHKREDTDDHGGEPVGAEPGLGTVAAARAVVLRQQGGPADVMRRCGCVGHSYCSRYFRTM